MNSERTSNTSLFLKVRTCGISTINSSDEYHDYFSNSNLFGSLVHIVGKAG